MKEKRFYQCLGRREQLLHSGAIRKKREDGRKNLLLKKGGVFVRCNFF